MGKRLALLLAYVALAIAALGCGGDDDDEPSRAATQEESRSPAAGRDTPARPPRTVTVRIDNERFKPRKLSVPLGSKVVWINDEDKKHTVTKETGSSQDFDSDDMRRGDRYSVTFTRVGSVAYLCKNHFQQTGVIRVR
jgi:plastocyanin